MKLIKRSVKKNLKDILRKNIIILIFFEEWIRINYEFKLNVLLKKLPIQLFKIIYTKNKTILINYLIYLIYYLLIKENILKNQIKCF